MRGAAVLIAFLPLVSTPAWADCSEAGNGAGPGGSAFLQLVVNSGETCREPIYSSAGPILGLRIIRPAAHGAAATIGLDQYEYRSRPGYVGPDRFAFALSSPRGVVRFVVAVRVAR